jgi:hypothetical protein
MRRSIMPQQLRILSSWSAMRKLARNGLLADHCLAANAFAMPGQPVSYCADLLLPFSRPNAGFRAVAAMPAAKVPAEVASQLCLFCIVRKRVDHALADAPAELA